MGSKSAKNSHFGPINASIKPKIGQNKYLSGFYEFQKFGQKIWKIGLFLGEKGLFFTRHRTENGTPTLHENRI